MSANGLDEFDDELLALANDGVESEEEGEASSHHSDGSVASRSPSRSKSRSPSPRRSASHTLSRSPRRAATPSDQLRSPQRSTSENKTMSRARSEGRRKDDSEEEGEASDAPGSPDSMGSVAMDESDSEASDNEAPAKQAGYGETAFEREKRLAEQAEREEERQKHAKLKALITGVDRSRADSSKPTKRKAEIDDDDFDRRASRQRTKKDEGTSRRIVRRKGLSETPPPDYADDSLAERNDGNQPGTLPEYERVRMGRSRFGNVCFSNGFSETFVGAFARVCSSQDPMTGQNTYRICQIKDFKKGKPYKLETADGAKYMTDQYVVASYGTLDREYPFNACSDSRFTEDEFHRRIAMLQDQNLKLTTAKFLTSKCKDINEFLDRPKTHEDISAKIERQNRLAHLLVANGPVLAVGPNTLSRDLAVHKRNLENRKLNEDQVRKALMADRRKRVQFAENKARMLKEEEERKKKEEDSELFGDDTAEVVVAKPKEVSKYVQRDPKKGLCSFTRVKTDDEMIADLGIDIDIEI